MNITQNWFYKLSDLIDGDIHIAENLEVFIYDDTMIHPEISVAENTTLHYISFFQHAGEYNTHITCEWENSKLILNSLIYSRENKINTEIMGEASSNNTSLSMNIIALAAENGDIRVDGNLKINSALKSVFGRLDEQNIFLGTTGKLSGLPTLLVESNDIDASHGCKMEKISDEELFYLRSRGIDKATALQIMLEAKIQTLLTDLEKQYPEEFSEIKKYMLSTIIEQ